MEKRIVKVSELEIGDIVRMVSDVDEGYCDATVCNVTEQAVYFFRPYVHTSDFITTSGVITYVGHESYCVPRDYHTTYYLLSRRPPEETRQKIRAIVNDAKQAAELGQNWKVKELLRQL